MLNAYTYCILITKLECIYKAERTVMLNEQVIVETNQLLFLYHDKVA